MPLTSRPRSAPRWLPGAAWATVAALLVVRLTWAVFSELAEGGSAIGARVLDEVTGILFAIPIVFWIVSRCARLFPWRSTRWRAHWRIVPVFMALSVAHTVAIVTSRAVLAPRLGLGTYPLDLSPARFLYEGATDLVNTVAIAAVFIAALLLDERGTREQQREATARALLDAELRTLRLRLEPHFLFNALNTISATLHTDVAAADAQLGHLSALLRAALRHADAPVVPLREELALLEHYCALLRARFEDRLTIDVAVPDALQSCRVPALLLQPLVENAVRHGGVETTGRGTITVAGRQEAAWLHVTVHDDGRGLRAGADPLTGGTGLAATAQRLRLLYGEAHAFRAGNDVTGFLVEIRLPLATA